jgi:50S ribosomal protein L16 3-hydroxylase
VSNPFNSPEFLSQYWQQSPLLIRSAFQDLDLIEADELAGLAMEPDVESRIIIEDTKDASWHVKHGSFSEDDFANLPSSHWTLLVQAVDHWVPEVREVLKQFNFLPQWRIDDIMISFATNGGGVGPHFDQYDVFLIQLEGKRQWKTGQLCDENSDLVDQMPVKILSNFEEQDKWDLEPGDVLYLPPGYAHWGTSIGDSMTLSVGFRAPSESEFVSDFGHFLASSVSDFKRYEDKNIENRIATPHEILDSDVLRLQKILEGYASDKDTLAQWLGHYMTEPKYADSAVETGSWSYDEFIAHWQKAELFRNAGSRIAHTGGHVFVDGQSFETSLAAKELNTICDSESFEFNESNSELSHLLWELLNLGAVFFEN